MLPEDVISAGDDRGPAFVRLRRDLRGEGVSRYVFHIGVEAADDAAASVLAVAVAEALGLICVEVDTYTAALSSGAMAPVAVFCMADGPGGAFCARPVHDNGWHVEAGHDGLRWGDGDTAADHGVHPQAAGACGDLTGRSATRPTVATRGGTGEVTARVRTGGSAGAAFLGGQAGPDRARW